MNNLTNIAENENKAFDEEKVDIKGLLMKFVRKWHYFAVSIPLFLAFAFVFVRFATPMYKVKTTLFISEKDKSNQIDPKDFINSASFSASNDNIDNEIGILKSNFLITRTLGHLDFGVSYFEKRMIGQQEIYKYSPFLVKIDSFSSQIAEKPFEVRFLGKDTVEVKIEAENFRLYNPIENKLDHKTIARFEYADTLIIGEASEHPYLNFRIEANPLYEPNYGDLSEEAVYTFVIRNLDLFSQEYVKRLKVSPINKDATILELSLDGAIPNKEVEFLNMLTDQYIENEIEQKNNTAEKSINFIDRQLAQVSSSLEGAEDNMVNVKGQGGLMNASFEAEQTSKEISDLENKMREIDSKYKYYKYLEKYLNENSGANDVLVPPTSMDVKNTVLNELVIQLQSSLNDLARLDGVAGESNMELRRVKGEVGQLKKSLKENVKSSINASQLQLTEVRNQIAGKQGRLSQLPSTERTLGQIQRDFNLNEELFNYLMQKRAEAGIAKASNAPDNKVLDDARQVGDKPISPQKPIIFGAAFLLALLLPIGVVLIQDFLHDKIDEQEQIERLTNIPIVGVVGKKRSKDKDLKDDRTSNIAEAFRAMRVNLQFIAPGKEKRVMAFTSTISAEGKTFCSANLATMLALSDKKVALVGADLRKPRLFEHFELGDEKGVTEFLIGDATLNEVLRPQPQVSENLSVINSGVEPPMNPAELLSSTNFTELIAQLKAEFDYVIIDTPPVGLVSDYFIIKELVDVTLYVVRHGYSRIKFLQDLDKAFKAKKFDDISLVLNGVSTSSTGGYYGYGYGYGYNYNNYYKKGSKRRNVRRKKHNVVGKKSSLSSLFSSSKSSAKKPRAKKKRSRSGVAE
ncbi:polysaccharide biosynthesis tyrosine autokinase [Flammeovirgaceae bacterium SG7u.111]|nr:polysaccharide biosynthesis tyrosine autokinase [Flammeovirgaceae bacterium SG7u.132]WPO34038.1 polysaccharide biosynthesis tyrosine autokinase [Flammeovirgaceae bacterium SG7u.111]